MELFYTANFWLALSTLTLLELILGIDNLVFLAVVTSRLPKTQQKSARRTGLALACVMRLGLLFTLSWMMQLTHPLFTVFGQSFSSRDVILIVGGLFLLTKATQEIHDNTLGLKQKTPKPSKHVFYFSVITQIMLLDIIFSLDSVITAIGLAQDFFTMALAIVIAVIGMIFASEPLTDFINRYPTLKTLALSFLLLIGVVLIADGFRLSIPRGYIYFSIGFSLFVESINLWAGKRRN